MKSNKIWVFVWLLGFSATAGAASDEDLLDAAKDGDVSAIQAALKSGTNVNTRFKIGKTALMFAAERGRSTAVEALINAGADMYILDNNRWDVLAHAAYGKNLSTFDLLLTKGFDPSRNNWRALDILRSFSSRFPDSYRVKAQAILEEAHNKNPGVVGGFSQSPNSEPVQVRRKEKAADPVFLNVTGMTVTSDLFKRVATKAFLNQDWSILITESDQVTALYTKKGIEYQARILFRPPLIKISYIDDYVSDRSDWLESLKNDMEFAINVELTR